MPIATVSEADYELIEDGVEISIVMRGDEAVITSIA